MRLGFTDFGGREANEDGIAGIEEGFRSAKIGSEVDVVEQRAVAAAGGVGRGAGADETGAVIVDVDGREQNNYSHL